MNKKLTYNEIIEALGRCGYHQECCFCNSVEECGSKKVLVENTLDFINRQQTENKRLGKEVNLVSIQFQDLQERYEEVQAKIEKLNAENMLTISERNAFRTSFYDVLKQLKIAKSKTYKEVAERLKEFMHNKFKALDEYEFEYITERDITKFVKEVVGENSA